MSETNKDDNLSSEVMKTIGEANATDVSSKTEGMEKSSTLKLEEFLFCFVSVFGFGVVPIEQLKPPEVEVKMSKTQMSCAKSFKKAMKESKSFF